MVVFKMRDSVPSARYSSVCNVLCQWNISLIPTYRVYRLYDIYIYINIYKGPPTPDKFCLVSKAVEAARKFNVNAVDCISVLRVTCPCYFVCVFL